MKRAGGRAKGWVVERNGGGGKRKRDGWVVEGETGNKEGKGWGKEGLGKGKVGERKG